MIPLLLMCFAIESDDVPQPRGRGQRCEPCLAEGNEANVCLLERNAHATRVMTSLLHQCVGPMVIGVRTCRRLSWPSLQGRQVHFSEDQNPVVFAEFLSPKVHFWSHATSDSGLWSLVIRESEGKTPRLMVNLFVLQTIQWSLPTILQSLFGACSSVRLRVLLSLVSRQWSCTP